jgi:hypothetical protein
MPLSVVPQGPDYIADKEEMRAKVWAEALKDPEFRMAMYKNRSRRFGPEFV